MTKSRILLSILAPVLLLLVAAAGLSHAQGPEPPAPRAAQGTLGTAFTYQGQLKIDGEPVDATCDMAFRLYDDASAGLQVGETLTHTVVISDGFFTQALDFGAGAFSGDARWLDIQVLCAGLGDTAFTPLGHQALTAAPYAQYASSTGALHGNPLTTTAPVAGQVLEWDGSAWGPAIDDGTAYAAGNQLVLTDTTFSVVEGEGSGLDADLLDGQDSTYYLDWDSLIGVPTDIDDGDDDTTYTAGTGLALSGTEFSIAPTYQLPQACSNGQIAKWGGSAWTCANDDSGPTTFWSLAGNAGTDPAADFLGTTDDVTFTVRVSNTAALRIVPHATSANLIGGYDGNWVTDGVYGAVIAGGGHSTNPNRVTDNLGVIGGGQNNQAGDNDAYVADDAHSATVSGGWWNTASGPYATVGGGRQNTASGYAATAGGGYWNTANQEYASIGGGRENNASGPYATVGGGYDNTASGGSATVPGGNQNSAAADRSFAAGYRANANHTGAFVWADTTEADFSSTAANQFAVRATGGVNFQTGGAAMQVNGNTVWHAGNGGAGSGMDADLLDGHDSTYYATAAHTHSTLTAGNGLTGGSYNGSAAATFAVAYGAAANTAVQGNQTANVTAGNGLSGGTSADALGDGFTASLAVGGGNGITANADDVALGPLTANWNQTGAYDVVLGNASSELQILESTGGAYYGTLDVGDLSGNQTYTFSGASGTVWTSGNDGTGSTLDADLLDGQHASAFWNLAGNAGTDPATNFIGTTDSHALVLRTNNFERLRLTASGYVGVGTSSPSQPLDVAGNIQSSGQLISTAATGMAPLVVNSTARVANLNADLLDGQHGSYYQARVSGTCAVGSTIRAINADGTVVCQFDAPLNRSLQPLANIFTSLDTDKDFGLHTSATIGSDGLPLISYYDATNGDLRVAHCSDLACSAATITTLDTSDSYTGQYTSVAIGSDGLGLISYYSDNTVTGGRLKVVHCGNVLCNSGNTVTTLDTSSMAVGQYTSVAIGVDGLGLISYYDATNTRLKVLHCGNVLCSSGNTISILDTATPAGLVGQYTSIAIGADGLGVISYFGYVTGPRGALKVAHCSNVACSAATVTQVDQGTVIGTKVGEYTSVTIGADGLPLISYYGAAGNNLKVAHCSDVACTAATVSIIDNTSDAGQYTSITRGADGLGLISYYDVTNFDLKVAHCTDLACSSATFTTLDSSGIVGLYSSATIGVDGLPLISYYDSSTGDLNVLHCSSTFCTPYFRTR